MQLHHLPVQGLTAVLPHDRQLLLTPNAATSISPDSATRCTIDVIRRKHPSLE
ncbi:hypothetical protein JD499_15405 [Aeromonas enteropelogenes]|uniref:hypothetical protein n=1 Tax=Aeromonas enteropelogenes TaxID=29489 RepID=UPI00191D1B21|nr:hypothetical protein [Aeromonas enteropelogenes]MBL0458572.1 hypothetical protein [Aeromonas enteropelogenes]